MKRIEMNPNWQFCQRGKEKFPAEVPGCNYSDLLRLGQIEDPFVGENEAKTLWVGETDWDYFGTVTLTKNDLDNDKLFLYCKQLDTLCSVYFNDSLIAKTENVHISYSFDITELAKEGENTLRFEFDAPVKYIKDAIAADKTPQNNQGLTGLTHIRKAQCHFGWDWGPVIPISGITGDICVKAYTGAKVKSFEIEQNHADGKVEIYTTVTSEHFSGKTEIEITVKDPDGKVIDTKRCENGAFKMYCTVENPRLWWTNDLSEEKEQPLYTVETKIFSDGVECDFASKKIGLRTLTLDRSEDQWSSNFCFVLNGVKIFAKGGNYIPMDSLITRVTDDDKLRLIENCVNANLNMIRVWGGGYYESDEFYYMCDRLGVLVWQDFMFACAPYPFYNEKFLANVKREIEFTVKRLRHHASLAIWCGNNEIEAMALGWKAYTKLTKWTQKFFYEILPPWVKSLDDKTPFINTSPIGSEYMKGMGSDDTGDTHLWQVWHGLMPLTFYRKRMTRFCSEFGLESMPSMKTVRYFAKPEDYSLTGKVFNAHQKSPSGNQKMYYYIASRYLIPKGFSDTLYLSQLIQQEGVRDATEHWRRNRGRCNGSIYWQLNDCWPVCSWAGIDYLGMNKAVQFASKKFNAPITVSVEDSKEEFKIFVVNDTLKPFEGEIHYTLMNFDGEKLKEFSSSVKAEPVKSTFVETLKTSDLASGLNASKLVLAVRLLKDSKVVSERIQLFGAEKDIELPKCNITAEAEIMGDKVEITLSADKFARNVLVESDLTEGNFSDNFMDIIPGEEVKLTVKVQEGVTAQALKESLTYTTVGNIENNYSKLYGRWTQFRIKMIPINFITWIGRALGID